MKIKTKDIICFLLLFFLLKPVGIDAFSESLNSIMNALKLISMIYISVLLIKRIVRGSKSSTFLWLLLILEILSIFTSAINMMSCYSTIIYWQTIISVIVLGEIKKGDDFFDFFNIALLVYKIYILINFVTILMWPNGYDYTRIYFLGNKTMQILYILPLIFLLFIQTEIYNKKKYCFNNVLYLLISIYTLYINQSSTSIIALGLAIIYYIFCYRKPLEKIVSSLSTKKIGMIIVIVGLILVFGGTLGGFSYFINDLFGKDFTFTGRIFIWERAIQMIQDNPLGYGWDALVYNVSGGLNWNGEIVDVGHAHNLLLTVGYKVGIIGLIIYVLTLFFIAKVLDDKQNFYNNSIRNFLKVFFFIFLIISIVESYPTNCAGLYLLLYLAFRFHDLRCQEIE